MRDAIVSPTGPTVADRDAEVGSVPDPGVAGARALTRHLTVADVPALVVQAAPIPLLRRR